MMEERGKKKPHFLTIQQLNEFLTDFCSNKTPHDYNQCLLWHPNMSPNLSIDEVRCNHLRRKPIVTNSKGERVLAYMNLKCQYSAKTCPRGFRCDQVMK